jgi:hypothetical protein
VNGCGAIAEARDGTLTAGFAKRRRLAQQRAKAACGIDGGFCVLRVTACSR